MRCTLQKGFFSEDKITFNEEQLLNNIAECNDDNLKAVFTQLLNILRFKALK